jgi:hypothetical protein
MRHGLSNIGIGPVRLAAFLLLAGAYCAFPNARPDLTAFNANDSEAYLALSYGLSHGLGYTRSLVPGDYIAHTTWPPGVPLLLAPVMALMQLPLDWYALKLPMILIGICGVALTWLYVRRLTSVTAAADLAAVLVASSPFYWHFSRMDMSEGSLLLIDVAWAGRTPRYRQAALIGMIAGVGMLLRGTLIGLALAPLGYLVDQRRTRATRVRQLRLWIAYCAGFCVAFVGWAARNHSMTTGLTGLDAINQIKMLFVVLPTEWCCRQIQPAPS